jgi:surface polysaccharide O-acyltransferase-like enzyme
MHGPPRTASTSIAKRPAVESSDPAPSPPAAERIWLLDPLRIAAIFEIVTFHAVGRHAVGFGFGLPCFLIFMTALAARKREPAPFGVFVRGKLPGILRPWVFWSGVYAAARVCSALIEGEAAFAWFEWTMPLYGPVSHLWYLPFAAGALVAVNVLQHATRRWNDTGAAWVLFASGAGLLALSCAALSETNLGRPLPQWLFAVPSVPLGAAIGRAFATGRPACRVRLLAPMAILLAAAWLLLPDVPGTSDIVPRYTVVGAATCLMFLWPTKAKLPLQRISVNVFGVYLIHPLLLMAAARMSGIAEWHPLALGTVAFALSLVAASLIRRAGLGRFV